MPSKNHLHTYHRVDIGQPQVVKTENGRKTITTKEVWVMQCKECTHYTRMRGKWACPLLIGKVSICNKCGDKFVLDRRALRLTEPTCSNCTKSKKKEEVQDATKFFDNLLEGIGLDDIK
jgi:formylmethanofuran dehydrogenase subunit E